MRNYRLSEAAIWTDAQCAAHISAAADQLPANVNRILIAANDVKLENGPSSNLYQFADRLLSGEGHAMAALAAERNAR